MAVRARAWGLSVVLALVFAMGCAHVAFAHASLVMAEPADGSVVSEPPAQLRLTFNEPVSPLVFRLLGPNGKTIDLKIAAENETVTLTPAQLRRGTHVLSWRVISADGHPVGGSLVFSVGQATAPPADAALAAGDPAVHAALWVTKIALYIGLFVGLGGAFFGAWFADAKSTRSASGLIAAVVLGLVGVVYSVSFQGLDALDLPFMDALDPATWAAGVETSYGFTAGVAAVALIAGLVSLLVRGRGLARVLSLAGIVGAALALSLSGHAATAPPPLLTAPAVFVHALCVAFWIGALAPLIGAVRGGDGAALARFSRIIPYPLAALVISGAALAFVQLDRIDALWTTNYGLVLSAKLAVVLALLMLAAANRYRLVPRFEGAGEAAARPLTMSIKAEWALAVLILALVAVWRFTPPPRALAAAEPASIHFHGQRAMAQIDVVPVRARGARVTIDVLDDAFRRLNVKAVTLAFSNRAVGIEPLRREATRGGDGLWRIEGLHIPIGGRWRLRVEILIDDFDKVVLEDDVELPRAP